MTEQTLSAAQGGDERAFERLVAPHRRELQVHCYRMLGSTEDAEDAVQETLIAAWRGLAGFEGRSSLRAWLYRIATNTCLRMASKRMPRLLSWDHAPARAPLADLGAPVTEPVWLDPLLEASTATSDPAEVYGRKEHLELAYVAALQHLPPNQRAVLVLRDVLDFSAAEVAEQLDTSVQSVNSALQRARTTVAERVPARSQEVERSMADERGLVDAFVTAFEAGDVSALIDLLAEDVRFTMPPLPTWFDGRDDVAEFFAHRVFETRWRSTVLEVNGQPAIANYQETDGAFRLAALIILNFRDGRISWIASFLDPESLKRLELPATV